MNPIVDYLAGVYPISDACQLRISEFLKTRHLSKREFLLKSGEVCDHIYFVVKGLLRCYREVLDHEVTVWLRRENSVVVSMKSYYRGVPSLQVIQALEETVLLYISREEEESLYRDFPEFNGVGRLLTRRELLWQADEKWNIQSMSGMERYQYLLSEDPELVRRVPVVYLASYLGLEPESLSRIRRQMSK